MSNSYTDRSSSCSPQALGGMLEVKSRAPESHPHHALLGSENRSVGVSVGRERQTCSSDWFLQWNEFLALLGGASWASACANWSLDHLAVDRRAILPTLAARYSSQRQFLFEAEQGRVPLLEVYWLKLRLFSQLCDRVIAHYNRFNAPHLGLHPSRVQIQLPEGEDLLFPARWQFAVNVPSSEAATPFTHEDIPTQFSGHMFQPVHAVKNIFQAPEVHQWPLGHTEKVTLLIQKLEQMRVPEMREGEDVRGVMHIHILSEHVPAAAFTDKDVIVIDLSGVQGQAKPLIITGKKAASAERGLVVSGTTEAMTRSAWEHLKSQQHQVWNGSTVRVYRSFHVPCDLHSLGVMFLQALVAAHEDAMVRLEAMLPNLCLNMEKVIKSIGIDDSTALVERMRRLLTEHDSLFAVHALVHPDIRSPRSQAAIPHDLWTDGLLLAFRLITRIPGFSYCANSGDYEEENPTRVLTRVLSDVHRIGMSVSTELFGSSQRNREIQRACRMFRDERCSTMR